MKETEVLFLIDMSGSMEAHKANTYTGFRELVDNQRALGSGCFATVGFFHQKSEIDEATGDYKSKPEILHVAVKEPMASLPYLSDKLFRPDGGTPILDAVGITINKVRFMLPPSSEQRQVALVLITDGEENASEEYTMPQIADMITELRRGGWKFLYINVKDSKTMGDTWSRGQFAPMRMGFLDKEVGTGSNVKQIFSQISEAIGDFRSQGELEWKK